MSIRKALGAIKDQTSISIAKVTGGAVSPELDVAVVRATSHDDAPADDRHAAQLLRLLLTSDSSGDSGSNIIASIARRLARTRDYVVAAKCLTLVHRLVAAEDGADPRRFRAELLRPAPPGDVGRRRAGEPPLLALVDGFRDDAHAASWDHSAFVRAYAAYLDARVRFLVSLDVLPAPPRAVGFADDPIAAFSSSSSPPASVLSVHEMDPDALLTRARQLRHQLDRLLACRPSGSARTSRVVLAALRPLLLNDGVRLHADVAAVLAVLLDRFFEMEYGCCVKTFEAYVGAARQIDELIAFFAWCGDVGVVRSSDLPSEINRIDDRLLETLEQFLRERGRAAVQSHQSSPPPPPLSPTQQQRARVQDDDAEYDDMNSVKALPAPPPERSNATAPAAQNKPAPAKNTPADHDQLVDLWDPAATAEADDKLALALFNAPPPATTNGDWVTFPSDDDDNRVTSAWQTPAAEPGNADWELALVETASTLSRQKAAMGGGLDPLLLSGMYDTGAVRRHVAAQAASGSASSVAFPCSAPVLALPASDGTVHTVGGGDPFAASLAVPPPSYVQMAEMEWKQQLLVQEQQMWARYRQGGMQGQLAAGGSVFGSNASATTTTTMMMVPYGMPASVAYNQNQVG